ncbi:hypothetical protein BDZ89DRAFT_1104024 [Hymenopellis radicata]|nr:hypothetical protein BDZ89DRAFT_1104024 [Hymenopellis radicata]
MGLHFFDKSPSWPSEQLARLGPPTVLLQAGIPCVVWAEDALSIVHRVPTVLFDTEILVSDDDLQRAAQTICSKLPYAMDNDDEDGWKDLVLFNKDRPHAFDIGGATLFLRHHNPVWARENEMADRILLHAASVFHFDVHDPSRTCLNPEPPSEESRGVRFPTLAAFYDALIATQVYPPRPFIHTMFEHRMACWISYLTLYTLSDKGICTEPSTGLENSEKVLIPACFDLLEKVKPESRPYLIRHLLTVKPLERAATAVEMESIRAEEWYLKRLGLPLSPPRPLPYSPRLRAQGRDPSVLPPRLTPYLVRHSNGKRGLEWRALAKYASIARTMLR